MAAPDLGPRISTPETDQLREICHVLANDVALLERALLDIEAVTRVPAVIAIVHRVLGRLAERRWRAASTKAKPKDQTRR